MKYAMNHHVEHNRQAAGLPGTGEAGGRQGYDGYDAARTGAVVYPRGPRGILALAGADAVSFLHGVLTNDIEALAVGQACYAAYLSPQGRMLSDMDVLRRSADLWLDVEPGAANSVLQRFDSSIFTEDVSIANRSGDLASVGVYGPRAAALLARLLGEHSGPMPAADEHMTTTYGRSGVTADRPPGELTVLGTRRAGIEGFHLFANAGRAAGIVEDLTGLGAPMLDAAAAESLRIEAGIPRFGADMTGDTIPLEAGIQSRAISMTKGCYVGQEVIVRILHRGHGRVARRLMGLRIEGDIVPPAAAKLVSVEREAGYVTSAIRSPRLGVIALGYVHRDFLEAGTRLQVANTGGSAAVVTELPFRE